MERQWKLGVDLHEEDNLLDGFTFSIIIDALHCNEPEINEAAMRKTIKEVLGTQLEEMESLIDNNIEEIIKRASRGRTE